MIGNFVGFNAASNNATDPFGIELSASEKDEKKFKEAEEKLDEYVSGVKADMTRVEDGVIAAGNAAYKISPMKANRDIESIRGNPQTIFQRYQAVYKSGNEVMGIVSPLALNVGVVNIPLKDGKLDVSRIGHPVQFKDIPDFVFSWNEGSLFSQSVNFILPGGSDMSLTHDFIVQNTPSLQSVPNNQFSIIPAYLYNTYGLIGKPINMAIDNIKSEQPKP